MLSITEGYFFSPVQHLQITASRDGGAEGGTKQKAEERRLLSSTMCSQVVDYSAPVRIEDRNAMCL